MKHALVLALLFAPSMVRAEDTGAIMAALRDEGAECRYLLRLCETVVAVVAKEQGNGTYGGSLSHADAALADLLAARRVLEIKHPKPPTCIAVCDRRTAAAAK